MSRPSSIPDHPAAPYAVPFVTFLALLALLPRLPLGRWEQPVWILVLVAVLGIFSRRVIDFRPGKPITSVLLGVAVFLVWVAPDFLWPGYRAHWLFQNPITGHLNPSAMSLWAADPMATGLRAVRAVLLAPIIEELFWRGWLMRWLIRNDFLQVPLGAYSARSFWITALLFASEHGPYWDVGLLAGIAYNLWIIRTKKLGDCILAHAVTNGLLSAYVIFAGRWEYWM